MCIEGEPGWLQTTPLACRAQGSMAGICSWYLSMLVAFIDVHWASIHPIFTSWSWRVPEYFTNTIWALPRTWLLNGLTQVVELSLKGVTLPPQHFATAPEKHWNFCEIILLIQLEIRHGLEWFDFGLPDFQAWSLAWSDTLSRHKGTELTHGRQSNTHEKTTVLSVLKTMSWCGRDFLAHLFFFHAMCQYGDGAAAVDVH